MSSFNISVRDLKGLQYKSENEQLIYARESASRNNNIDIIILGVVDTLHDVNQWFIGGGPGPTKLKHLPMVNPVVVEMAIDKFASYYSFMKPVFTQLSKIYALNVAAIQKERFAETEVERYLENFRTVWEMHQQAILEFLSDFHTSYELAELFASNIKGLDTAVVRLRRDQGTIAFREENNLLYCRETGILIPIGRQATKYNLCLSPAKALSYQHSYGTSWVRHLDRYMAENNGHMIAVLYEENEELVREELVHTLYMKKMHLLNRREVERIESADSDKKAEAILAGESLAQLNARLEDCKPLMDAHIKEVNRRQKAGELSVAEMAYDLVNGFANIVGEIDLYKEVPAYKKEAKQRLVECLHEQFGKIEKTIHDRG